MSLPGAGNAVHARRPPVIDIVGILIGLGGLALMFVSLQQGTRAALDGSEVVTTVFVALFLVGTAGSLTAGIIALLGLIRGGHRVLSGLGMLVALVPVAAVIALRIASG